MESFIGMRLDEVARGLRKLGCRWSGEKQQTNAHGMAILLIRWVAQMMRRGVGESLGCAPQHGKCNVCRCVKPLDVTWVQNPISLVDF